MSYHCSTVDPCSNSKTLTSVIAIKLPPYLFTWSSQRNDKNKNVILSFQIPLFMILWWEFQTRSQAPFWQVTLPPVPLTVEQ